MTQLLRATFLALPLGMLLACGGQEPTEPTTDATPPPPEPSRCVVSPVETGIQGNIGQNLGLIAGAEGLAISGKAVMDGEVQLLWSPLDGGGAAAGEPIPLRAKGDVGASARVGTVWTGDGWLMVWDTYTRHKPPHSQGRVHVASFDASGKASGKSRAISESRWDVNCPRLAWSGAGAGAVWSSSPDKERYTIGFRPLAADGKPTGPAVDIAETPRLAAPVIAWDGSSFGIAWRGETEGGRDIFFARVSPTGEVEVPAVQVTKSGSAQGDVGLAATTGGFGLTYTVYHGGLELKFASLSRDGIKAGESTQINEGKRALPRHALASNGAELGVVWADGSANESGREDDYMHDLYFTRLSLDGERLAPPQRVTETRGLTTSAVIAWVDGAWFVGRDPNHLGPLHLVRLTDCDTPE